MNKFNSIINESYQRQRPERTTAIAMALFIKSTRRFELCSERISFTTKPRTYQIPREGITYKERRNSMNMSTRHMTTRKQVVKVYRIKPLDVVVYSFGGGSAPWSRPLLTKKLVNPTRTQSALARASGMKESALFARCRYNHILLCYLARSNSA